MKCVFAEYKHLSGVDRVRSKKKHLLQLCVSKSRSLLSYQWVNVGLLQSSGLSLTSPSVCFPWVTSATLKALTFTSASATSISTLTTPHISPELQSPMSNCPPRRHLHILQFNLKVSPFPPNPVYSPSTTVTSVMSIEINKIQFLLSKSNNLAQEIEE